VGPWTPADFGYPEATWQDHAQAVVANKLTQLQAEEPADARAARIRARRIQEHQNSAGGLRAALTPVQRFTGLVDQEVVIAPNATGALGFLATLPAIQFFAEFFEFDTDCQTGTVTGTLGAPTPPALRLAEAQLPLAAARGPRPGARRESR
jgi:hypothetical protein